MKNWLSVSCKLVAYCAAIGLLACAAAAQDSQLTVRDSQGHGAHMFPSVNVAAAALPPATPLVYHGGPVIQASLTTYAIFWVPATLQTGGATSMTAHYQTVQTNLLKDYPAHGIDNNNTQYYQQTATGAKQFIQNKGGLGGVYVDTNPYPASGCSDAATPGACITDTQLQTELVRVMGVNGWIGGLNKMFLVFTSSSEGSCLDSSHCSYTYYCAYHSYIAGAAPIIYGNEPFGDPGSCQTGGTPSPNADPAADTASTAASHEITEAVTDPELNAWYTAGGSEIGDLCAYNYGANTFDGALANQWWNGHFYELQTEYSNHVLGCVRVGP